MHRLLWIDLLNISLAFQAGAFIESAPSQQATHRKESAVQASSYEFITPPNVVSVLGLIAIPGLARELEEAFLWNEQTEIVQALLPEFVAAHPEVLQWFELACDASLFKAAGAVVAEWASYAWVGCPRGQEIGDYLSQLGLDITKGRHY